MRKLWLALLTAAALLTGAGAAQPSRTLTVFAAASLTDAFTEIGGAFEADHPGVRVLFNFGGSSTLAAQIIAGAPADLFASANLRALTNVQEAGLLAAEPQTFAHNRLALIVPSDNPAGVRYLRDLAQSGLKLVLAAPGVPVRDYTEAMLDRMTRTPLYGEAYRAAFYANIVSEEDNVRQVAAKVALGEADAGIVYRSDVTPDLAADVNLLVIPDRLNAIATYPLAPLVTAADPDLAADFAAFVLSDAGQQILAAWNFMPVTPVGSLTP